MCSNYTYIALPLSSTNAEPAERQPVLREKRAPLEDVKPDPLAHPDNPRGDLPEDIKLIAGRKLHERADGSSRHKSELSFWDSGGQVSRSIICGLVDLVYAENML